ncbi:unnamed protein product [Closterium sp. NIES-53]
MLSTIKVAALGATESALLGIAFVTALHTLTLDSAPPSLLSLHLYQSDWLTPLGAQSLPVPPLFSRVRSTSAVKDAMVTTTTLGGQRVSICTCTRTVRHLATFTRKPGSSLYTLATEPPQLAASAQVSASGPVAPSCSCRLLSHQTLLWHHRLGHPSLPRLRGMHSCLLVSGLPRSLPPLPPSPAPPCLPCVEGRQHTAPHSSSFPPMTAPLQTLHMGVWGSARVSGQGRECYFLLVVDDYTRYTRVFPLRSKNRGGEFSPHQLRERFARRTRLRSGAAVAGVSAAGDTGAGGVGVPAGAGGTRGAAAADPVGARTRGIGAAGTGSVLGAGAGGAGAGDHAEPEGAGVGGTGAGGAGTGGAGPGDPGARVGGTGAVGAGVGGVGAGDTGTVDPKARGAAAGGAVSSGLGAGDTVRPRPYFVPLLQQVLGLPSSTGVTPPLLCPPPNQSQPPLQPASPLPTPSPYIEQTGGLTSRRELESPPASPVCALRTGRRVPRPRPPPSTAASALVAELVEFAAACRVDYATALVAESESASAPSVGGECALCTDVLEDRQEDFECPAAAVPHAVPPSRVNIVDGMWILRVKRPPGSPPAFKVRYVARGFSQRQGVDYFQTFSPTLKMTTLRVLLHVAAQRDYELHSLDFSTSFLQGSLHEEIGLRHPPGFTGSFPAGTQWSLRRPVYSLHQAPRKWHDTLSTTLAALGFAPTTADPSLFLHTDTSLPPFYVLVYVDDLIFTIADTEALTLVKSELQKRHTCTELGELRSYLGLQITWDREQRTITLTQSHMVHQVLQLFGFQFSSPQPTPLSTSHLLSAPPSDESLEPSGLYPGLVGCLIMSRTGLVLGGRGPVVLTGHADASWVDDSAAQRSLQGYTFSLDSGSVSCRAMAAQELHWLTYLLTDLGEQPRSPPVLYVDNKAMIALCQEHRLEHRAKHIALRYFLARELQQSGQLRLAYVATRAITADIFTKALPPGDHQRFSTVFGLVPALPHLLIA